ncbi:hypothetical protein EZV62_022619 [Acer yangbiense]|uniref:DUF659 domain-containing protein n=1 Tax=Acer yangbiense TaxID=1000413 RepID=A0A5C7H8T3_9ROSI|nr:hypothetical protein EZV62_022619 [Acer yangbiense]
MNLCVNSREGTTFHFSKERSNEALTREHIFEYVFKCIEQVGPQNVVQVVTDNASNNMATVKILKETMPHIFWSSCATYTINLMLEARNGKCAKARRSLGECSLLYHVEHRFLEWGDNVLKGICSFGEGALTS